MIELFNPYAHDHSLFLYPVASQDIKGLHSLFIDKTVTGYFRSPLKNPGNELNEIETWIEQRSILFQQNKVATFAAYNNLQFVGITSLTINQKRFRSGSLLIAIRNDQRKQGYGSRIRNLITNWAIVELGLAELTMTNRPTNLIVERLAQSAGFHESKDGLHFTLTNQANNLLPDNRPIEPYDPIFGWDSDDFSWIDDVGKQKINDLRLN